MSKSIGRRQSPANNNKVPLVMQRLLAGAKTTEGKPLLGERFVAQYQHNRQVTITQDKQFQADITALHESNAFKEIPYGRGKFTYVSVELAAKIEELHAKYGLEAVSEANRGKGWSYAELNLDDDKPAQLPPSTDHTKFTQYVQTEEVYASEEEKVNMKVLLARMSADLELTEA